MFWDAQDCIILGLLETVKFKFLYREDRFYYLMLIKDYQKNRISFIKRYQLRPERKIK